MSIVFFTGFPGFLGSELLPRVLERSPEHEAVCLIQPKFIAQARSRLEDIEKTYPHSRGRIELVEGDITAPDLGLERMSRIQKETSEVFHLQPFTGWEGVKVLSAGQDGLRRRR